MACDDVAVTHDNVAVTRDDATVTRDQTSLVPAATTISANEDNTSPVATATPPPGISAAAMPRDEGSNSEALLAAMPAPVSVHHPESKGECPLQEQQSRRRRRSSSKVLTTTFTVLYWPSALLLSSSFA